MSDEIKIQELEMKVREWKAKYDDFSVKEHEAVKLKSESDNLASQIVALMNAIDTKRHKTYYGVVSLTDTTLKVSNHAAQYEFAGEPPPKRRGRPKKSESVAET